MTLIQQARQLADLYRSRGWNPLPARTDAKRPMIRFAEYWDKPVPADLFQRFATSNIQLVLGARWHLMAIDLDGPEAREWFSGKASHRRLPVTWKTISGDNGCHLWFCLPESLQELPRAVLWRKAEAHTLAERLCDRSLLLVPPSIHPKTGRQYQFASRRESPYGLSMPALCPDWILNLRSVVTRTALASPPVAMRRHDTRGKSGARARHLDRDRVLSCIPDKLGLVRSWGVRITGRRSGAGWEAHAIHREDVHPSAVIFEDGSYWDCWHGRAISLFDLGVELGVFQTWHQALQHLGGHYSG